MQSFCQLALYVWIDHPSATLWFESSSVVKPWFFGDNTKDFDPLCANWFTLEIVNTLESLDANKFTFKLRLRGNKRKFVSIQENTSRIHLIYILPAAHGCPRRFWSAVAFNYNN